MNQRAANSVGASIKTRWSFSPRSLWLFLQSAWPLTKPTISLLVVFTAIPELWSESAVTFQGGLWKTASTSFWTLLGIFLASGSSAVFNHIVDADIDLAMQRTKHRPVPSGAVSQRGAKNFGISLGILSLVVLYFGASPLAALLGLLANIFYAWFYTAVLKRRTDQNIVIGGAAGAIGPLIGCAAVTDSLSLGAWLQFFIIFLWTPPHFWALALKYQNDYREAQIPMLPVTRGDAVTRQHIFLYTLTLFPTVGLLWFLGDGTWFYGLISLGATGVFAVLAFKLYQEQCNAKAMKLFIYSCLYLFIVFGSLSIERLAKALF